MEAFYPGIYANQNIMIRQYLSSNYLLRSLIHPRFKTNNYKVIKASLYLNAQPAYYSHGQKILGEFILYGMDCPGAFKFNQFMMELWNLCSLHICMGFIRFGSVDLSSVYLHQFVSAPSLCYFLNSPSPLPVWKSLSNANSSCYKYRPRWTSVSSSPRLT